MKRTGDTASMFFTLQCQSLLLGRAENDGVLTDNPPLGEMSIFRRLPALLSRAFAPAFLMTR